MRSAGCIVNDILLIEILIKKFLEQNNRPIASGKISHL